MAELRARFTPAPMFIRSLRITPEGVGSFSRLVIEQTVLRSLEPIVKESLKASRTEVQRELKRAGASGGNVDTGSVGATLFSVVLGEVQSRLSMVAKEEGDKFLFSWIEPGAGRDQLSTLLVVNFETKDWLLTGSKMVHTAPRGEYWCTLINGVHKFLVKFVVDSIEEICMSGSRVHSVNLARADHMRMELSQQWDSLSIQLGLKGAITSYLSSWEGVHGAASVQGAPLKAALEALWEKLPACVLAETEQIDRATLLMTEHCRYKWSNNHTDVRHFLAWLEVSGMEQLIRRVWRPDVPTPTTTTTTVVVAAVARHDVIVSVDELSLLRAQVAALSSQVQQMQIPHQQQSSLRPPKNQHQQRRLECWNCGGQHERRHCPTFSCPMCKIVAPGHGPEQCPARK